MQGVGPVVLVRLRVVDLSAHRIGVGVVLDSVRVPTDDRTKVGMRGVEREVGKVVVAENDVLLDSVLVRDWQREEESRAVSGGEMPGRSSLGLTPQVRQSCAVREEDGGDASIGRVEGDGSEGGPKGVIPAWVADDVVGVC